MEGCQGASGAVRSVRGGVWPSTASLACRGALHVWDAEKRTLQWLWQDIPERPKQQDLSV